jgi:hypothetical protein
MAEQSKKMWKYSQNLFDRLNPSDMSVAAKWPLIDAGDVVATASTAVISPTGNPADSGVNTIAGDATSGQHGVAPVTNLTAELSEFFVYARAGNKTILYLADTTVSNATAYFNLSTGVLGTVGAAATADIRPLGNGWYRCAIRFTGTTAAHTFHISPVDADASTTMTGGDGATVNVYLYRPGVCALRMALSVEEDQEEEFRTGPDGDLLIAGYGEDLIPRTANISKANATRSAADRVLVVQPVDASGNVIGGSGSSGSAVDIVKIGGQTIPASGDAAITKGMPLHVTDGTYSRRLLGDSSGVPYSQPYTPPTFEDTTSGLAKVELNGRAKYQPTKTSTASFSSLTTTLAAIDMTAYGPFWVFVKNTSGTNALTACNVDVSPDSTSGWYTLTVKDADETACQTLAANATGVAYKFTHGLQGWLRLQCNSAGTTTDVWIVAQK